MRFVGHGAIAECLGSNRGFTLLFFGLIQYLKVVAVSLWPAVADKGASSCLTD